MGLTEARRAVAVLCLRSMCASSSSSRVATRTNSAFIIADDVEHASLDTTRLASLLSPLLLDHTRLFITPLLANLAVSVSDWEFVCRTPVSATTTRRRLESSSALADFVVVVEEFATYVIQTSSPLSRHIAPGPPCLSLHLFLHYFIGCGSGFAMTVTHRKQRQQPEEITSAFICF